MLFNYSGDWFDGNVFFFKVISFAEYMILLLKTTITEEDINNLMTSSI